MVALFAATDSQAVGTPFVKYTGVEVLPALVLSLFALVAAPPEVLEPA